MVGSEERKKRLSLGSVIFLVVGSCVGAGVFFKTSTVLKFSNYNVPWSIFVWLLASLTVAAMALSLTEITSKSYDNLSIVGWSRRFNSRFTSSCCKYFFVFIYLPLNYFFMPNYVIMSFQDGLEAWGVRQYFGYKNDWLIISGFGLIISGWFILSGISTRLANIKNWIISSINLIPLAAAVLIGLYLLGDRGVKNVGVDTDWLPTYDAAGHPRFQFFTMSPLVGIFGALSAIFFAFDGFYFAAGVQTEMRDPRKISKAIILGILVITLIYLSVSMVMTFTTAGGEFKGYNDYLQDKNLNWMAGLLNISIGIGVLSIINGISLWFPRFLENLAKEGELYIPKAYRERLNPSWPKVGVVYEILLTAPIVILCDVLGGLGYFSDYTTYDAPGYDSVGRLYTFGDLMSTWTSVFCFGWIALVLIGGLRNRRSKRVEVERNRYFVLNAVFATVIVSLSVLFSLIQPFADLFINKLGRSWAEAWAETTLSNNLILILTLLLFVIFTTLPAFIECRYRRKQSDPPTGVVGRG